ncbi:DUF882 domain-containing protein [Salinarimonas rosea]|uniref:DUF882 domain-containing protein n=1 Tax=Salinarimonas rosea TaxID=552063 RepID=UPI000422EE28|nr:DUF882 domain-containing protein [Salinarimonas rosea]
MTVQRPSRIRRGLSRGLACLAVTLGLLVAGTSGTQDAIANGDTRTLSVKQMHTREQVTVTFRRNGRYDREALSQLDWIMRDWRRDQKRDMDPRLYDALWEVHRQSGSRQPLHVVSAYRSPQTNEMLRSRSRGVARTSQHIEGRATDFYLPDVPAARLRTLGMRLQRGGVGFYPRANTPFVHIDVGSVRHWPRMTRSQLAQIFPDGRTVHLPSDGRPLAGYDDARRQILAAGGIVQGEQGTAVAGAGGTRRSLWAALFGDDEGEASGDEAYAALPTAVSEIDQRYALMHAQPAAAPQPRAPEPEPAPTRVASASPNLPVASVPVPSAPVPSALVPSAPVPSAPVPIAPILTTAPRVLPPARPALPALAPVAPEERTRIAALAEEAARTDAAPTFATAASPTVLAAIPAPRPAAFGGAGTVAATPSAAPSAPSAPADAGPRLVWQTGPQGVPAAGAAPATEAVQVALAPVPPPRFDRQAPSAAPAAPASPPVVASAFAPIPPLRGGADAFAAVAAPPATPAAPTTTASAARAASPAASPAADGVASLPERERSALRTLFAGHSLAPAASAGAPVRVASARVSGAAPSGLVAVPAAGVAQGFRPGRPSVTTGGFAGPAVRQIASVR